jgi:hypothetical protein
VAKSLWVEAARERCHLRCMIDKVPFGGVCGWLADLAIHPSQKSGRQTQSYYVAEPAMHRAMTAIRVHAKAKEDAIVTMRRALSKGEIAGLKLKPGEVKPA